MACGAEQHPSKPMEFHGTGWESSAAGMGRGTSTLLTPATHNCGTLCLWQKSTWVVLPSQLGGGYSLRQQSQGSLLLGMSSCAQRGGLMGWYSTWRHNMAPHSAPAQPSRQALTMLCCCHPEQGQAALLGEWDGEEGGLAERLAWLRQWAHGHERLLPRIWTRYSATISGVPLKPHGPQPCIPAAPGASGPWCSTLRHPKITNRWQDFLTREGLLHCIYFIAEETAERCEGIWSASLWCLSAVTIPLPCFLKFWPKLSILFETHESCFC